MMKLTRSHALVVLALAAVSVAGCRPRATRSTARNRTQPAQTVAGAPTAKSVLNHADSALARVSALAQEAEAEPVMAENPPRAYAPSGYPVTPWGAPYVPLPNTSDYGVYQAALGAYNGHQYDEALRLFSQVVSSGRPAEMVPAAYYWMGETYYAMGRYAESMPYFEYVTNVGPQYKREMSMYKLSRANLHLGNRQGANLWYERLRSDYPRSGYITTLRKLGAR